MKLLVLGATGQTGREVVAQGLVRGASITALVRSPKKLSVTDARLEVIEGDPLDERALVQAVAGKDAVLSLLGHTNLKASSLVTDGAHALSRAMGGRVRRVVLISSTLVAPGGTVLTGIPRLITRHAIYDSAEMEGIVRQQSDLDWTVLRLVRLTSKAISRYRLFEDEPPSVTASVSRSTVASCMLDLVYNASHVQKTISVRAARPDESERSVPKNATHPS